MTAETKQVGGEQQESDRTSLLNVTTATANTTSFRGSSAQPIASQPEEVALPQQVKRFCRPKMMPVSMPAPLGPKMFILGEPVLHRYYSVYDWSTPRIGFGLAANRRNLEGPLAFREGADRRGSLPEGVDTILMQQQIHVAMDSVSSSDAASVGWTDESSDETIFAQVTVSIVFATQRHGHVESLQARC